MAGIELLMTGADTTWNDSIVLATELPDLDGIMARLARQMGGV